MQEVAASSAAHHTAQIPVFALTAVVEEAKLDALGAINVGVRRPKKELELSPPLLRAFASDPHVEAVRKAGEIDSTFNNEAPKPAPH